LRGEGREKEIKVKVVFYQLNEEQTLNGTEVKFLDPDWGYIVDSGMEL
jgi:hypothetical protein